MPFVDFRGHQWAWINRWKWNYHLWKCEMATKTCVTNMICRNYYFSGVHVELALNMPYYALSQQVLHKFWSYARIWEKKGIGGPFIQLKNINSCWITIKWKKIEALRFAQNFFRHFWAATSKNSRLAPVNFIPQSSCQINHTQSTVPACTPMCSIALYLKKFYRVNDTHQYVAILFITV